MSDYLCVPFPEFRAFPFAIPKKTETDYGIPISLATAIKFFWRVKTWEIVRPSWMPEYWVGDISGPHIPDAVPEQRESYSAGTLTADYVPDPENPESYLYTATAQQLSGERFLMTQGAARFIFPWSGPVGYLYASSVGITDLNIGFDMQLKRDETGNLFISIIGLDSVIPILTYGFQNIPGSEFSTPDISVDETTGIITLGVAYLSGGRIPSPWENGHYVDPVGPFLETSIARSPDMFDFLLPLTLSPKEFWPYKNSAGDSVWDTGTGNLITPVS